jgi:hypothetical protein
MISEVVAPCCFDGDERSTAMDSHQPHRKSCHLKSDLGMAVFTIGVLLTTTLWLIPLGLAMAITGVAMFDPGQPRV